MTAKREPTYRRASMEDVAFACLLRWAVSEKSALKYLKANFTDPIEAYKHLCKHDFPPDAFWQSL